MLSPVHALQLVLGPTIWFIWFGSIYGALSAVCALAAPPLEQGSMTWINGSLFVLTVITTVVLAYGAIRCWRAARRLRTEESYRQQYDDPEARWLIGAVSAGVHLTAAVATLAVGLPVLYLPSCL